MVELMFLIPVWHLTLMWLYDLTQCNMNMVSPLTKWENLVITFTIWHRSPVFLIIYSIKSSFHPWFIMYKNFFFGWITTWEEIKLAPTKYLWKAFLVMRQCMMKPLECIPNFPFQLLEVCTLDYMKKCLHLKKNCE